MQVFKAYFMVTRHFRRTIFLSFGVFILAFIVSIAGAARQGDSVAVGKVPIAIVNQDKAGEIAQSLAAYLSEINEVVDLPSDRESLQDALFYKRIAYVVIIPAGFSHSFNQGESPQVEKVVLPNAASSHFVDLQINRFLTTAEYYQKSGAADPVAKTLQSFEPQVKVTLAPLDTNQADFFQAVYFRFLAYPLLALIMSGISGTMLAFNREDLYRRNLAAPLARRGRNLQLLAGHGVYAFACWLFFVVLGLALFKETNGLYLLNSLVFTAVCVSLGFLLGDNTKSYNIQSGAVQIISLGMTLLGGVSVDFAFMHKSVLKVAKFLPSYWYVLATNHIAELTTGGTNLQALWLSILIQLGFAAALIAVTLFLRKELAEA